MLINGNQYKDVEIDFNAVCELEDMGINIYNLKGVSIAKISRAYLALCMGGSQMLEVAGEEINQFIIKGGKLKVLYEAFGKAVQESHFFQALQKAAEERETESKEQ